MAPNKNWPSMFRSKPRNNHHHNGDTQSYMHYSSCNQSSSFASDPVPDPKPRWNPKPEQIRILESIFNSGIINPSREEINRIRIRLEEYGQIGDVNVFYWFQNRKSRAKHKLRILQKNPKSSKKEKIITSSIDTDPCFGLVNQETGLFPSQNNEVMVTKPAGFVFPVHDDQSMDKSGFDFGDFVATDEMMEFPAVNNGVNLAPEINFYGGDETGGENCFSTVSIPVTVPLDITPERLGTPSFSMDRAYEVPLYRTNADINQSQDEVLSAGEDTVNYVSPARLTVCINDMPYEMDAGLFNVKEAFGNDAILINSFGQPVLTDEFGVTFQPLQNGAVYYLI